MAEASRINWTNLRLAALSARGSRLVCLPCLRRQLAPNLFQRDAEERIRLFQLGTCFAAGDVVPHFLGRLATMSPDYPPFRAATAVTPRRSITIEAYCPGTIIILASSSRYEPPPSGPPG